MYQEMDADYVCRCYQTLTSVIGYRGATPLARLMNREEVIQFATIHGYCVLESIRANESEGRPAEYFIQIVMMPSFTRGAKSPFFKKVFTTIARSLVGVSTGSAAKLPARFEVIMDNAVKKKSIAGLPFEPKFLPYDLFISDITQHVMAGQYRIATPAEIEANLFRHYILLSHLPTLPATDSVCIYYDFRPGMVVHLLRLSENTGEASEYYLIK